MTSFKLPLLQEREAALETCAYCPKLCRAACPVADVESSETLTPWGKMGIAWYQARGSLELNSSYAATAWGCTTCYACREHTKEPVRPFPAGAGIAHAVKRDVAEALRIVVREHDGKRTTMAQALRELADLLCPST